MSNNYFDATGVLTLKKVTPIIKVMFQEMSLDSAKVGLEKGQAFVHDESEGSNLFWENMQEHLIEFVRRDFSIDVETSDLSSEPPKVLFVLADRFKVPHASLNKVIQDVDFDGEAAYSVLFALARLFDDGHGLSKMAMEGSWTGDRSAVGTFGGMAVYVSENVTVKMGTTSFMERAIELDALLTAKKVDDAADAMLKGLKLQLEGISNAALRQLVSSTLKLKLATL